MIELYLYTFMVIISLSLFLVTFKYFLMVLMMMEVVVMTVSVLIFFVFSAEGSEVLFLYYLVFSVCESAMGLTLLVLIIRFYGDDYYKAVNLIKF